jgi:Mg2+ and Co2+ transporter CorA
LRKFAISIFQKLTQQNIYTFYLDLVTPREREREREREKEKKKKKNERG